MEKLRDIALGVLLVAALLLAVGIPCVACGFHGQYFRNNFYDDWERLKPRLGDTATVVNRLNGRPVPARLRDSVMLELLNILRYVDPYNDAPDSPAWMHTEEGREHARESAQEILHELGAQAVPAIWEALESDLRFETAACRTAMRAVRRAQEIKSQRLGEIRFEMRRFPKLKRLLDQAQERDPVRDLPASWADLAATLPIPVMAQPDPRNTRPFPPPAATPARDGRRHRAMPQAMWDQLMVRRAQAGMGIVGELQWIIQDPGAAADAKLRSLLQGYQQAANALTQEINRYRPFTGQHSYSDMVPAEEFRPALESVLARIGKAALPVLEKGRASATPQVAQAAARLVQSIQAQKDPLKPAGVGRLELPGDRLALLALELWDLGAPAPDAAVAARAREALKALGRKAIPEILQIVECASMQLVKEGLQALELLTDQRLGDNPKAWRTWYEESVAQERLAEETLKKAPAASCDPPFEVHIGPREQPAKVQQPERVLGVEEEKQKLK